MGSPVPKQSVAAEETVSHQSFGASSRKEYPGLLHLIEQKSKKGRFLTCEDNNTARRTNLFLCCYCVAACEHPRVAVVLEHVRNVNEHSRPATCQESGLEENWADIFLENIQENGEVQWRASALSQVTLHATDKGRASRLWPHTR